VSLSFVTEFGKTDKSAVLVETELPRPCVMGKGVQMRCWQSSHPPFIALRCPDSTGLFSEQTHFSGRQTDRQKLCSTYTTERNVPVN